MAADPIEVVGAGIRTARLEQAQPDWWTAHRRRVAANQERLYLAAQAVLADRGSLAAAVRLQAAVDERDDIAASLAAHLDGRAA